jgi:predicted transcriptional regulator of viral defense system
MKEEISTLPHYLEHLQSRGQYWFVRQEVLEKLQLTDNAFRKAAHRLMTQIKLNRIRGDFYTLIPLEYRATGSLPATWFIDALMKYLNQNYYVALLTAAGLHEAAHQQPMVFQVITDKPTRSITAGQVRIQFFYKKNIAPQSYQPIKTASGTMNVSTPEITAVDLVRYMTAAGQINQVATVLCELSERLNPKILATLLNDHVIETTAAQRLGYLLDILGAKIDLEPLVLALKEKKMQQRLLVAGSDQPVLSINCRWNILVNEPVEPDEL